MKVGAYTVANASPGDGFARNVTVTVTADGNADTMGTVTVTGTDRAGAALTEAITPVAGSTVQGTKAFKTVTGVVGADWVINGNNDHIVVGFGDLLGLADKLSVNSVLFASLNGVREGTAPTVTVSSSVLALNTVDLSSALNGTTVDVFYLV